MKRYAETFFRYWVLALFPILALPLGSLLLIKTPATAYGIANIWADGTSIQQLTYVDLNVPPATNMANYLNQLLLSSSFDNRVAKRSPLYTQYLIHFPNPQQIASLDLPKNAVASPGGPNLVNITYTSKYPAMARQVVGAILSEGSSEINALNRQQAAKNMASFTKQLNNARGRYTSATQSLGAYMSSNGISGPQLDLRRLSDAKLATLYQAVQSAQVDVTLAEQALAKARSQQTAQGAFRVIDPPTDRVATISKSKKLAGLAVPLALGMLLSLGFVVVRTAQDRSLRFAEEVPEALGLPVLAVVPHSPRLAPRPGRKWSLRPEIASAGRNGS